MNSLLYALIVALRCHRWLRLLACAFIFSSLGNGLTQVVVFGLLLAWSAPPALLTLAFLFATVPGFFGSMLGERLCSRYSPISLLILTEGLGLLALLFPLLGVGYHSVVALLAVQSTEALLSGMSWPALTLLFKRGLSETELPAATCLENVIFASQVLLGTGLGVVLFQKMPVLALLTIDAISFLGSLVMLWLAERLFSPAPHAAPEEKGVSTKLRWQTLTVRQKRSLLILPALAAVGSPAWHFFRHWPSSYALRMRLALLCPCFLRGAWGSFAALCCLKETVWRVLRLVRRDYYFALASFWPLMECCRLWPTGQVMRLG